jgi:hypothetical protein
MAFVKKGDVFVPESLADEIPGAYAGMRALAGTGAAIINTTMPFGRGQVGDIVKVPYFDTIGELEELVNDGDALTPRGITDSYESAQVKRAGIAIEATKWAQWASFADPYKEGARQMGVAVERFIDRAVIDVAKAAGSSLLTLDVWSAGTPVPLGLDVLIDARAKFGDESGDWAAFVMHSAVEASLYKVKDTTGRPILVDPKDGGLPRLYGIPIVVSDKLTADATDPAHPKYETLLLKKGAVVFWMNGKPVVKTDEDILADTDVAALHLYWVAYRYKRMSGGTKPGVVKITHNVSASV